MTPRDQDYLIKNGNEFPASWYASSDMNSGHLATDPSTVTMNAESALSVLFELLPRTGSGTDGGASPLILQHAVEAKKHASKGRSTQPASDNIARPRGRVERWSRYIGRLGMPTHLTVSVVLTLLHRLKVAQACSGDGDHSESRVFLY